MKVLLLSADKYQVTNETTGEIISGTTLYYLNNYREDGQGSIGLKPTKIGGSNELFQEIKAQGQTLPALVSLQVNTKPGAGGKASLVCVGVEHLSSIELFDE